MSSDSEVDCAYSLAIAMDGDKDSPEHRLETGSP
jgi:hypothetical protein